MKRPGGETAKKAVSYSAGTVELGVSVVVGIAIGYTLDRFFDTAPWLTLFWLVCGVIAGFRSLFRVAKRLERESEAKEDHGDAP
jgi:ATP synthase protein I